MSWYFSIGLHSSVALRMLVLYPGDYSGDYAHVDTYVNSVYIEYRHKAKYIFIGAYVYIVNNIC